MPTNHVVLVHGLISSSLLMRPLGWHLRNAGFHVHHWSYFSMNGKIEQKAERLSRFAERLAEPKHGDIHFVGHSMGAIIIRRMLIEPSNFRVGRFVMLAPPNRGSHVATRFSKYVGKICPALYELSDEPTSYVNQMPVPSDVRVGIISAGGDLVVRDESVSLGIESDRTEIPGMHSGLLFRTETFENVSTFLKTGRFVKTGDEN